LVPSVTLTNGKTTLTAAITKVLTLANGNIEFLAYDQIDKAPEVKGSVVSLSTSDTLNMKQVPRDYDHVNCPGQPNYLRT
jgi:GTPases - translation elongation factors